MLGIILAIIIGAQSLTPGSSVESEAKSLLTVQSEAGEYTRWEQPAARHDYVKIEPLSEAFSEDTRLLGFYLTNSGDAEYVFEYEDIKLLKKVGGEWFAFPNLEVLSSSSGKLVLKPGDKFIQVFDISLMNGYTLTKGSYGISAGYSDRAGNKFNNFIEFPVVEKGDIRTYEVWEPKATTEEGVQLELEQDTYPVYPSQISGSLIVNRKGGIGTSWILLKKMENQWRVIPRHFEKSFFPSVLWVVGTDMPSPLTFSFKDTYDNGDIFDYSFTPGEYAIAFDYRDFIQPQISILVFSEFTMR